jgi:hypothetical protein
MSWKQSSFFSSIIALIADSYHQPRVHHQLQLKQNEFCTSKYQNFILRFLSELPKDLSTVLYFAYFQWARKMCTKYPWQCTVCKRIVREPRVVERCIAVEQGLEHCGEVLPSDEVLWNHMACLRCRQHPNTTGSNLVNGDRE